MRRLLKTYSSKSEFGYGEQGTIVRTVAQSQISRKKRVSRCAFALLLGALVGLLAFDTATATSSGELLPSCLEIVNRARPVSGGDIDIPPSGLSCWHQSPATITAV